MGMTYDESTISVRPNGGMIAQRTDLPDNEGFFVVLDRTKQIAGCIQVFKDGTACYWRDENEQATPAKHLPEAYERIWVIATINAKIASCPKCHSTEIKSESAFSNWHCAKCNTMVWSPPPKA